MEGSGPRPRIVSRSRGRREPSSETSCADRCLGESGGPQSVRHDIFVARWWTGRLDRTSSEVPVIRRPLTRRAAFPQMPGPAASADGGEACAGSLDARSKLLDRASRAEQRALDDVRQELRADDGGHGVERETGVLDGRPGPTARARPRRDVRRGRARREPDPRAAHRRRASVASRSARFRTWRIAYASRSPQSCWTSSKRRIVARGRAPRSRPHRGRAAARWRGAAWVATSEAASATRARPRSRAPWP